MKQFSTDSDVWSLEHSLETKNLTTEAFNIVWHRSFKLAIISCRISTILQK